MHIRFEYECNLTNFEWILVDDFFTCFFFSSRRRHTRLQGDWSSDVCSSDLAARVLTDGRYRPGFYAHTANAALIYEDVKSVYDSLNISGEPPFWVAGNTAE